MTEPQCESCVNRETDLVMRGGQVREEFFCFLSKPCFPTARHCEDYEAAPDDEL